MAKKIVFTTCLKWPDLFETDSLVASALEKRGYNVTASPWNGEFEAFSRADLVVLRANWDYHHDTDNFIRWLDKLESCGLAVQNPISLVKKNVTKDYLFDLEASGIQVTKSRIWTADESLPDIFIEEDWQQAVIKPLVGASGHQVEKVSLSGIDEWLSAVAGSFPSKKWLIQEFLPEVEDKGEISLVFFEGTYSHAILKQTREGEFRVNSQYQGVLKRINPEPTIIKQAEKVLQTIDSPPIYARIDGIIRDESRLVVCEMELNEPGLYLDLAPDRVSVFAEAIHSLL